jgi:hypothetical protein
VLRQLARWHIWLGWVVAIPVLIWTISGLVMTLRPIEEVRGEHLRAESPAIPAQGLVFPQLAAPIAKAALIAQHGRPVWVVTGTDKAVSRFSASDGTPLGPVAVNEARQFADEAFTGPEPLERIARFEANSPPLDLRRPRPAWQASFADGTRVYIDADIGEVLALRTRWWRLFDFMWGLHILDPGGREDTSHPWLWLLSGLAVVSSLFGTVLLFRRRRRPTSS